MQCVFRVDQLDQGQLVEGWFPLMNEDGSAIHRHRPMINMVLQYQSVLQVRERNVLLYRVTCTSACPGQHETSGAWIARLPMGRGSLHAGRELPAQCKV